MRQFPLSKRAKEGCNRLNCSREIWAALANRPPGKVVLLSTLEIDGYRVLCGVPRAVGDGQLELVNTEAGELNRGHRGIRIRQGGGWSARLTDQICERLPIGAGGGTSVQSQRSICI